MNLRRKTILPVTQQDCVVAVSGGADSMALLHFMKDHNKVTAVHINHNTNEDDKTSLNIVQAYCTKHNIQLDVFSISEKIESNFECQAREFRHSIFKQYKKPVYLGHTLDDQVEEYLMSNIKGKDITFECNSFDTLCQFECKDVVYLDPPYTNTKALYFGNISFDILLNWINSLPCSWFMNINGINVTDNEENISIPYTNKEILSSGKSSFSRMKGNDVSVAEYFYYNNKLTF